MSLVLEFSMFFICIYVHHRRLYCQYHLVKEIVDGENYCFFKSVLSFVWNGVTDLNQEEFKG